MQIQEKKSAIDLTELALGILILGVTVSIGVVILTGVRDSTVESLPTYTVVNQTVTTVTASGEPLTTAWFKSITSVVNATNGNVITSPNYTTTINGDGYANIYSVTSQAAINNSDWKVTYQVYNTSDVRFDLPYNGTLGLAEYGNWFKIIAIVGVSALILSLIFMAFGNRDKSQMGGTY